MDVHDREVDLVDRQLRVIKVKFADLKLLKIDDYFVDLVSGEGSSIRTGATSPTLSVK